MAIYLIDYENTGVKGLWGIETLKEEDLIVIFYGPKTGAVPFDEHVRIASSVAHVEYFKTTKTAKNYLDFQLTTYLGFLVAQTGVREYCVISKDSGYDSVVDFWKLRGIVIRRQENILNEKMPVTKRTSNIEAKAEKTANRTTANQAAANRTTANQAAANRTAANRAIAGQSKEQSSKEQSSKEQSSKEQSSKEQSNKEQSVKEQNSKDQNGIAHKSVPENVKKKIRNILKPENLQGGTYKQIYSCMLRAKDKQTFNTALVRVFTQEEGNHFYKVLLPVFTDWNGKKENI